LRIFAPVYLFSFLVPFFVMFLKTLVALNINFFGYYTWWVTPDKLPLTTLIDLMLKLLSQQIFTTVARTTCLG